MPVVPESARRATITVNVIEGGSSGRHSDACVADAAARSSIAAF